MMNYIDFEIPSLKKDIQKLEERIASLQESQLTEMVWCLDKAYREGSLTIEDCIKLVEDFNELDMIHTFSDCYEDIPFFDSPTVFMGYQYDWRDKVDVPECLLKYLKQKHTKSSIIVSKDHDPLNAYHHVRWLLTDKLKSFLFEK